jgi:hypothetical protein
MRRPANRRLFFRPCPRAVLNLGFIDPPNPIPLRSLYVPWPCPPGAGRPTASAYAGSLREILKNIFEKITKIKELFLYLLYNQLNNLIMKKLKEVDLVWGTQDGNEKVFNYMEMLNEVIEEFQVEIIGFIPMSSSGAHPEIMYSLSWGRVRWHGIL